MVVLPVPGSPSMKTSLVSRSGADLPFWWLARGLRFQIVALVRARPGDLRESRNASTKAKRDASAATDGLALGVERPRPIPARNPLAGSPSLLTP